MTADDFDAGYDQGRASCKAEIERLRAALKPFVAGANDADGYVDDHPIGCDPAMPLEGLTVGDLREARSALGIDADRLVTDTMDVDR